MEEWTALGPHRYRVTGDILWFETHGELNQPMVEEYIGLFKGLVSKHKEIGILADMSGGLSFSTSARKFAAPALNALNYQAPIAVIGASLPLRTIMTLFFNAQRLLSGKESSTVFLATSKQAVAWLEEKLAERRSQAAAASKQRSHSGE